MGSARPTTSKQPTDHATDAAATLVETLALALRNLAIYPASHPRVQSAAAACAAQLAAHGDGRRPVVLGHRDGEFVVDDVPVPANEGPAGRLLQEFRAAALRGIAFAPDCTPDDLLAFATALAETRTRKGTPFQAVWSADHPRLRATDLVFRGSFRARLGGGPTAAATGEPDATGGDPALQERHQQIVAQLTADAGITSRLATIGNGIVAPSDDDGQTVDLLTTIAQLLPAEVAQRPELVVSAVQQILAQLEAELPNLQRETTVAGADLLRLALGLARKYFQSTATTDPTPRPLPSGRPEDEAIDADLPRLLQQLDRLPTTSLRLPPAAEFTAQHPTMARELLGIHLHTLVGTERAEVKAAVRQRLLRGLSALDAPRQELLRCYLGTPNEPAPVSDPIRQQLVELLVEAGATDFVRELGFVDALYLARHFPASLRLGARVLGGSPAGLTILRDGLRALGPVLALGGVATAVRAGVLQDPAVIAALLAVGDASAQPLLAQLARQEQPAIRRQLVGFLQQQPLPTAAATVLGTLDPSALPANFVEALLRGTIARRFDAGLDAMAGPLLRTHVEQVERRTPAGEHALLVAAMDTLQHVPGPETTTLLQRLAARDRLAVFDASARAVRRRATELLARSRAGGTP